jgi:hypothetical protein
MATLSAARGLVTLPSELTRPDGALVLADNTVIDADNVIEQRRGFSEFGNVIPSEENAKQLMVYKGRILRHYASKIGFDSTGAGAFLEFDGTYQELENQLRIKYLEANSNFYFTTTEGVKKISATSSTEFTADAGYITDAGGIKAVGLEAFLKPSISGWFPAQSKVAYRIVWSIKDANNLVVTGVPSSRVITTNSSNDINVGERFTVTVLAYASISDSEYFTFDTPTNSFGVWFNATGTGTPPVGADLLGRQMLEVDISGLTTDENVATTIATVLNVISDVTIELSGDEVTITNRDGGDVLNASQGTLAPANVLVSTVYDGQTAVGTPANVDLFFTVPNQIQSTLYFYEIYRSAVATVQTGLTLSDIDPGDELQKVFESGITEADILAGEITVTDITPESFREGGAFLYTNPNTGAGILSGNEAPPIAKDLALFKGSVFYANTKERHKKQFSFLSVSDFTSGVSKLTVGNSTRASQFTFVGVAEVTDVTAVSRTDTVGNSYVLFNSAQDRIQYKVWFDKGIIQHSFDATADVTGAEIAVTAHGYANNDPITFSGVIAPQLNTSTTYYVVNRTVNTFEVSLTPGGSSIVLSDVVGTSTATHAPTEPVVADTLSLRVAMQTYPDTTQGSVDAFIEAFFDITDFSLVDQGAGVVKVFCADNGGTTDPVDSSPASAWTVLVSIQGEGEDSSNNEVLLSGLASVGQSVEDTARSLERVINKDSDCPVNAFYLSGFNDLPGILLLEARSLTDDKFFVSINELAIASKFSPEMPVSSVVTTIDTGTNLFTTSAAHGFTVGQEVYVNDNPNGTPLEFSAKRKIASVPSSTTFTLSGVVVLNNQAAISGLVFLATVFSDNSINSNRVYFSKINQPEHVPLINFIDVGPKDKAIQRILALRDSLVILKEDGVYILSGQSAPDFSVRLMDSSAITIAPDSAVNLNNLVYVLSSQGVVTVSETGVGVISRNIENKIQEVANAKFTFKLTSWGISSESDRCYILFLPSKSSEVIATQAFRYNTFTRTWTRWTKPASCGVVNPENDKIYLGDGSGRDYVLEERKNYERQDYSDREFIISLLPSGVSDSIYSVTSVIGVEIGDVIVQDQYLDTNKFNRMLKKLDRDLLLSSDYHSSLSVIAGVNLANSLIDLQAKLVTDTIAAPVPTGTNTIVAIQQDFNAISSYLNTPGSGTGFKNYKPAVDLLKYETLITSVQPLDGSVGVKYSTNFLEGVLSVFKGIPTKVQYAPQHFGKPEATKQIAEGTFIFDQSNFWGGFVGYASDRSANFRVYEFSEKGPGSWGSYAWADVVFGGLGNEVPVRTLIPIEKSRCRYLHVQFSHVNAREKWRLLGVSLEPREVSTRGYR